MTSHSKLSISSESKQNTVAIAASLSQAIGNIGYVQQAEYLRRRSRASSAVPDATLKAISVQGSPWHVNIMSNSNANLSVLGESTRLVPANTSAVFEIITSTNTAPADLSVHVISPSKRSVPARVLPGNRTGVQSVEFVPTEVGTHVVEVSIDGEKLPSGPLIAKVYDAGLIQVADVSGGVVGQPVQFRGKCKFPLRYSFDAVLKRFYIVYSLK